MNCSLYPRCGREAFADVPDMYYHRYARLISAIVDGLIRLHIEQADELPVGLLQLISRSQSPFLVHEHPWDFVAQFLCLILQP